MLNAERPRKRARILGLWDSDVGDVASEIDVSAARQANDLRLKSRFEDIFEKYGKDFSSVGDEIDLATGNIVIDNGHIERMRNEQDLGSWPWRYDSDPLGEPEFLTENVTEEQNVPNLKCMNQNEKLARTEERSLRNNMNLELPSGSYSDNTEPHNGNHTPAEKSLPLNNISLLRNPADFDQRRPRASSHSVAALWQTPEIDERLFKSSPLHTPLPIFHRYRTASPPNSGSLWAVPQSRRKKAPRTSCGRSSGAQKLQSIPKPRSSGPISDSDSDDPLHESLPSLPTSSKINIPAIIKNAIDDPASTTEKPGGVLGTSSPLPDHGISTEEENNPRPENGIMETSPWSSAKRNKERYVEPPLLRANGTIENEVTTLSEAGRLLADPKSITNIPTAPQPAKQSTAINPFTPNEIKIILIKRAVQKLPWKEVSRSVPNRTSGQLRYWYYVRSADIKNGPPTRTPLTAKEKDILESFKSKPDVSWEDLEAAFENQTRNELQCKWAEICLGKMWEAWRRTGCLPSQSQDGDFKAPPKLPKRLLAPKSPSLTKRSKTVHTASPSPMSRSPSPVRSALLIPADESSESDDPLSEAFGSAWIGSGLSTFQIDTPPKLRNPQRNRSLLKAKASPRANRSGSI
ncbi:centromere protein Scm3 domain-containing protein [Histoplasma capsulatum var. duboisii H88]|uniref:Centromere protein Scm3 domain-containing protein n=1 Tax=Ajellomyces capsulatus (strain H88) TaxID=544711 RepID=A0A8A1LNT7_AJEC8|nr:centromere protein Scm3 domain-containing protein [Histoplasma capsulatum var. duboisii H88]